MKKLLALIAVLALCATAQAGQITVYQGSFSYDNGGEFNATIDGGHTYFATFCLEEGETFSPGSTYNYAINTAAIAGGGGAVNGSDPISPATAWLYKQFWLGDHGQANELTGIYDFSKAAGNNRQNDAGALQQAIWYLENEISGFDINTAVGLKAKGLAFLGLQKGKMGELYGVRVMNLTASDGNHQDMLTVVPLPAAAWASFGMLGLLGIARMRKARR